jgi:hypothetical protein
VDENDLLRNHGYFCEFYKSLLSPNFFSIVFLVTKKGESEFWLRNFYGRFLSINIASIAPIIIITTMIAATPIMKSVVVAKFDAAAVVGAGVVGVELAWKAVAADDG